LTIFDTENYFIAFVSAQNLKENVYNDLYRLYYWKTCYFSD